MYGEIKQLRSTLSSIDWMLVCVHKLCVLHNAAFLYDCIARPEDPSLAPIHFFPMCQGTHSQGAIYLVAPADEILQLCTYLQTAYIQHLTFSPQRAGERSHVPREWLHVTRDEKRRREPSQPGSVLHVLLPLPTSFPQGEVLQWSNVTTNSNV